MKITLPARIIEIGAEEEKELQNFFLAYGKARRICYSLRQKYKIKGKMSRSEIIKGVIYARGDKSKGGNLNIRVVEIAGEKYLRVNVGDRKRLFLRLFILNMKSMLNI